MDRLFPIVFGPTPPCGSPWFARDFRGLDLLFIPPLWADAVPSRAELTASLDSTPSGHPMASAWTPIRLSFGAHPISREWTLISRRELRAKVTRWKSRPFGFRF